MIKVGIIGSGFGLYGLLPAFNSTDGCEVVCICGKNSERLLVCCKSIGLKKIYTDWKKMLKTEKLDAIAIAVTPDAQYEIAKAAINKGLHVFAEKPLAVNLREARDLLNLAKKRKIKHMVDFEFPEINEWKKVKELLVKKTYGELRQICISWDFESHDIKNKISSWKTDVARGGGALSYYFSHSLYYLELFAGEISHLKSILVYSPESLNGGEVGVDLLIKFKNGITGNAHMSCNSKGLNRHELTFVCQKATIVLKNSGSFASNFTIKIYTEDKTKRLTVQKESGIRAGEDERVKVVKKLTTRFIKAINKNKNPSPSFKEGVRVEKLIEQIRNDQKRYQ